MSLRDPFVEVGTYVVVLSATLLAVVVLVYLWAVARWLLVLFAALLVAHLLFTRGGANADDTSDSTNCPTCGARTDPAAGVCDYCDEPLAQAE